MKILMVALSVTGEGKTSGSSIRASRYEKIWKEEGHEVERIESRLQYKTHLWFSLIVSFLFSIPKFNNTTDIIYSISDLFPDSLFGLVYKLLHPKVKFICGCHSLVQRHIKGRTWFHPIYSYYYQKIILWLLSLTVNKLLVSNHYDKEVLSKVHSFKQVCVVYGAPNF